MVQWASLVSQSFIKQLKETRNPKSWIEKVRNSTFGSSWPSMRSSETISTLIRGNVPQHSWSYSKEWRCWRRCGAGSSKFQWPRKTTFLVNHLFFSVGIHAHRQDDNSIYSFQHVPWMGQRVEAAEDHRNSKRLLCSMRRSQWLTGGAMKHSLYKANFAARLHQSELQRGLTKANFLVELIVCRCVLLQLRILTIQHNWFGSWK